MISAVFMKGKLGIYLLLTSVYILSATTMIFGQATAKELEMREANDRRNQEKERIAREMLTHLGKRDAFEESRKERKAINQRARNEESRREIREEKKRIALLRDPSPEDFTKYKEFLKQPKTGLFRLFPDLGCDSKNLVRVDGDCANAVTSSWAYSFRRKDYIPDFLDITLKDGNLIADGFLSQEILVSLGNMPLENVSLTSKGMKFLVEFKPETRIKDASRQFKEIAKTIDSVGFRYGKNLRADLNTTYGARIVAYRNDDKKIARISYYSMSADERKFLGLEDDKRVDLTIAFRIVRKDADENITILWKELAQQNAPKIVFAKNEKLSDIKP